MDPQQLLHKVKKIYTAISEEFDATRHKPWPEFKIFLQYFFKLQTLGSANSRFRLLDVGCGNGRLLHFLKNEPIEYVGVDNNRTMLKIAKKKAPKAIFRYADILKLPFLAASFDMVWCIAVLHHLPTPKLQLQAVHEMKRVLKKNGLLMLMVWNLWQPKYKKFIQEKTHHALIPWKNKVERFYYAFRAQEIEKLLKKAGFPKWKRIKSERNLAYCVYKV